MRSHSRRIRWHRAVASALLGAQLAGCSSWRVDESVSPAELLASKAPSQVRVTQADDSEVVLTTPTIVGDSLWGWAGSTRRGLALADVTYVATRHFDAAKSVELGVGVVVGTVVVAALYCAATDCLAFSLNFSK